ncbi:hypothetical protein [Dulcicalothrix desertica]|uniref:hypothetical protein n=1 Tax=Dulcicalothrix desertica TaxID=32056 RepID=UPI000F8DF3B4|nr:hypothetical protein [Dulcicalothrix desertica]
MQLDVLFWHAQLPAFFTFPSNFYVLKMVRNPAISVTIPGSGASKDITVDSEDEVILSPEQIQRPFG